MIIVKGEGIINKNLARIETVYRYEGQTKKIKYKVNWYSRSTEVNKRTENNEHNFKGKFPCIVASFSLFQACSMSEDNGPSKDF